MKKLIILFFLSHLLGFSQQNDVLFYKENTKRPVIHLTNFNHDLVTPISNFQKEIKNRFDLGIIFSPNYTPNTLNINFNLVHSNRLESNGYDISINGNQLYINANSTNNFNKAITHFVYNMLYNNKDNTTIYIKNIKSTNKTYTDNDFEYREVYFSENFNKDVRDQLNTHHLELEWGLWGHNISKWVQKEKTTDNIYALVNNQRNNEQLCFSSDELKKIIHQNIKKVTEQDSTLNRFVIAPYDNNLVCQCNLCAAKGNTKTNATPAVFSLIDEMAKEYPNKSFWSLGYVTTATPPKNTLPKNVGVFLCNINSQEGLPLNRTNKGKEFIKQISNWSSKIENVYIWDYVVNFDYYMDFYPIYNTTKQNLNLYKDKGITGLFLQGSGYSYSILQDVKHYVLSSLINDSSSSVNELIQEATNKFYPEISSELYNFLMYAETRSINTGVKQNIYSSIGKAEKRYLAINKLKELSNAIDNATPTLKLQKLKTGILFLELEIYRVNGINSNGYASLNNNKIIVNPNIKDKLQALEKLVNVTKLNYINERKETFTDYLNQWDALLFKIKNNATYNQLTLNTNSKLDEDYNDIHVLNDAKFGFKDYHNNWLIYSGSELILNVEKKKSTSNNLEINFLSDTKHQIYLPKKIQIFNTDNNIIKEIDLTDKQENTECYIETILLSLPVENDKNSYIFKFINNHKSIAIDEIRFLQ